ncbi:hypothetical protein [Limosilactobacillus reuteri]|uniref:hypothetical protein n=1 Tax=Limosilactobacillus reuteri TaxID=1598 RepID=UPI00144214F6|nr:hypothetical protein [Limosilactobacillus reuteri]
MKYRLGDSLYIKGRIGWKGLKRKEYLDKGDYRIINGTNIINGKINWSGCGFIYLHFSNLEMNIIAHITFNTSTLGLMVMASLM